MQLKRQILLAACAASALAFGSVSAFADDDTASNGGYYVSADGGASFLPNLKLKTPGTTDHENFNTGYAYGGAAGYDNGDGMRLELDTTHQMSELNHVDHVSADGHLQSTSVMVNGQVDLTHHTSITPYVGAGIGYQNIGVQAAGLSDSDWKPAYQAEAGLRADVSQKVSLFGEYRFSQSEAAEIDDAHQHFADHGLLAGLTYHLGQ
jgi:opacity protein-like surface antigen